MELITWLVWLFTMMFSGLMFYGTPSGPVPNPPMVVTVEAGGNMQQLDATVESIEPMFLESFPVQIHLRVIGSLPTGCDVPLVVSQQRDGNQVTVQITQELPADTMCPMILLPLDTNVPLDGGFEPGTYTITVNGVSIDVTI